MANWLAVNLPFTRDVHEVANPSTLLFRMAWMTRSGHHRWRAWMVDNADWPHETIEA